MKVLITGGAGFIGSYLAEGHLKGNDEVYVIDNLSTGSQLSLSHILGQVEFIEGDVRSLETDRRVVVGIEAVFHRAALTSEPRSINDPLTSHAARAGCSAKAIPC